GGGCEGMVDGAPRRAATAGGPRAPARAGGGGAVKPRRSQNDTVLIGILRSNVSICGRLCCRENQRARKFHNAAVSKNTPFGSRLTKCLWRAPPRNAGLNERPALSGSRLCWVVWSRVYSFSP